MTINEHILKISGSSNLPEGLEIDKRYLVSIEVDCTDTVDRSNQNGTINREYKCKQTGDTQILTEGKKIIKAEKKQKRSQKLHAAIWYYWNEHGFEETFDVYYDRTMAKINSRVPEIIEFLSGTL
jgi:hypothetical protein